MRDYDEAMEEISNVFDVCAPLSTDYVLLMFDDETPARDSVAAEGQDVGAGSRCSTVRIWHYCSL